MTAVTRFVDKFMDTQILLQQTKAISSQLAPYDKFQRLADAMEELGETAAAMVVAEGVKRTKADSKQFTKKDVLDGLADTLYALILLADLYGADLFQEYAEMIQRLKKRVDDGEFVHD